MRDFEDDKNIREIKFLARLFLTIIGIGLILMSVTIYEILTK
jgi:hypothetical protein